MLDKTRKNTHKLMHMLVTIDVTTQDLRMHAYAFCPQGEENERAEAVIDLMLAHAKKNHLETRPVVALVTMLGNDALDSGVVAVREIIDELHPAAKVMREKAEKYHLSIWLVPCSHSYDEILMGLH